MEHISKFGIGAVAFLGAVQAALRTYFGLSGAGLLGAAARDQVLALIETPVSNEMLVIIAPFLILGLAGAAATASLAMGRQWGVQATVAVSVATIVYDMYAALTVQSSAVIGLVVPVITITYLAIKRSEALRTAGARA
ncbi:MAG: hypothetical protein ISF22_01860 [Methanomassiliicoccus sp.]|nr:hypothetical protein [Methanomassiliicoccus sp.]